jgi:hypothetical protein
MKALLLLPLLMACTSKGEDSGEAAANATDIRVDEDEIRALTADDQVMAGPDYIVEPYEDVMMCQYGTWEGGDKGIIGYEVWQSQYGHHLQLMGTTLSEVDAPDGTLFRCTTTEELAMENLEPIGLPTAQYRDGELEGGYAAYPEGFGVKLDDGQRYVMQSHVVNVTDQSLRVRDLVLLTLVEEEEVDTWTAPLIANTTHVSIPPGEEASRSFDCAYDTDYNILTLTGHMHEWGTSFKTELLVEGGEPQSLYTLDSWEAVYRDNPPVTQFEPGAMLLPAGTALRTTCNWRNDTEEPLEFPHEMCVTVGLVYPATVADICDEE